MDTLLFTNRSIWTMIHGIALGGGALMGLAAALFSLRTMRTADPSDVVQNQARDLAWLTVFVAVVLWLTVLVGTYVNFPPYRATPPAGLSNLSQYPRSLIQSNPDCSTGVTAKGAWPVSSARQPYIRLSAEYRVAPPSLPSSG